MCERKGTESKERGRGRKKKDERGERRADRLSKRIAGEGASISRARLASASRLEFRVSRCIRITAKKV